MIGEFSLSSGEIQAINSALTIVLNTVEKDENLGKDFLEITNSMKTARNKLEYLVELATKGE